MSAISSKALLKTTDPYKYNAGSELEEELGYYNTFFRKYDAQIGRFTGVDILAESTTGLSPFHFGNNNPIMFNDPTGALSDPGTGRMQKGTDGNYHVGWVSEMQWNNAGFLNWGSMMDASGGGSVSGLSNIWGLTVGTVVKNMGFGDHFRQNKKGDWGYWQQFSSSNKSTEKGMLDEVVVGTKFINISSLLRFNGGGFGRLMQSGGGYGASTSTAEGSLITSKGNNSAIDLGGADYLNANISIGNFYGFGLNLTASLDKFGNLFVAAPGISFGKSLALISASATLNNLTSNPNPSETQSINFLSGHGFNASAGAGNGVSGSWSPGNGFSKGTGFYTPQVGVSYNYTPDLLIFKHIIK